MKFFNSFISWKKNIKDLNFYELSLQFDYNQTSIENIFEELRSYFIKYGSTDVKNIFSNDLFEREIGVNRNIYEGYSDDGAVEIHRARVLLGYSKETSRNIESLTCTISSPTFNREWLDFLKSINGLQVMTLSNSYLSSWDNKNHVRAYKYRGGLKNIHYSDYYGIEVCDISNRPGRYSQNKYFRFRGASDYWFNNAFVSTFLDQPLNQFTDADKILVEDQITHVHLFNHMNYWDDQSQLKLNHFRKFLKIDELESAYKQSLV